MSSSGSDESFVVEYERSSDEQSSCDECMECLVDTLLDRGYDLRFASSNEEKWEQLYASLRDVVDAFFTKRTK